MTGAGSVLAPESFRPIQQLIGQVISQESQYQ